MVLSAVLTQHEELVINKQQDEKSILKNSENNLKQDVNENCTYTENILSYAQKEEGKENNSSKPEYCETIEKKNQTPLYIDNFQDNKTNSTFASHKSNENVENTTENTNKEIANNLEIINKNITDNLNSSNQTDQNNNNNNNSTNSNLFTLSVKKVTKRENRPKSYYYDEQEEYYPKYYNKRNPIAYRGSDDDDDDGDDNDNNDDDNDDDDNDDNRNFQYNGQIDEDFDEYDDDDEKNNIIDDDNYNEDIENDEISDYKYGERYLRKADKSTDISNNDDNFDLLPKHLPPLNFTELQLEAFTQFITNLVTAHMKQLEHEFSSMSNENDFKNESNNTLLNQTLKKLMSGNQNNAKEDSVINDIDMNNLTERDINENDHSRDEVRNPRNTMDETTNNPEGDYENNSQWYSHGASDNKYYNDDDDFYEDKKLKQLERRYKYKCQDEKPFVLVHIDDLEKNKKKYDDKNDHYNKDTDEKYNSGDYVNNYNKELPVQKSIQKRNVDDMSEILDNEKQSNNPYTNLFHYHSYNDKNFNNDKIKTDTSKTQNIVNNSKENANVLIKDIMIHPPPVTYDVKTIDIKNLPNILHSHGTKTLDNGVVYKITDILNDSEKIKKEIEFIPDTVMLYVVDHFFGIPMDLSPNPFIINSKESNNNSNSNNDDIINNDRLIAKPSNKMKRDLRHLPENTENEKKINNERAKKSHLRCSSDLENYILFHLEKCIDKIINEKLTPKQRECVDRNMLNRIINQNVINKILEQKNSIVNEYYHSPTGDIIGKENKFKHFFQKSQDYKDNDKTYVSIKNLNIFYEIDGENGCIHIPTHKMDPIPYKLLNYEKRNSAFNQISNNNIPKISSDYGNTVPNQHFKLLTPSNQQQKNMDRIISQNELNTDMQLSNNNDDYIRTDNSKSNKDKLTYKRENIIASKNTPYLINEIGSTSQTENKNDLASGLYSNRVSTPLFIDEKEKDMISKEANLNFDETIEREVINNYKSDSRTAKENLSNDKYELKKGENKGKEEATKTIIKDENFDDVHTKTNKCTTENESNECSYIKPTPYNENTVVNNNKNSKNYISHKIQEIENKNDKRRMITKENINQMIVDDTTNKETETLNKKLLHESDMDKTSKESVQSNEQHSFNIQKPLPLLVHDSFKHKKVNSTKEKLINNENNSEYIDDTCSCNLSHSTEIFSRKCCNKNKSDSPELYNKVVNLPDDKINYDNRQIRQNVNQALISEKQNNGIKNGKRIVDHEKEFENRSKNSEKYKTTQAEENIKKSNAEKSRNKEDNMKHKQINNEDENLKKNIKVQLADNIEKYEKSEKNQFSAEKQGKVNENVKKRENNEKEQINQDQSLIYNEQQIKNKTIKKGTDVKNGTKQKELYEQNDKSQNRNINNPEENEIRKHQISNVNRNEKVDNKVQSLKNQEANFALTNDEKNENLIKKWRQIEDNQFKLTKGKNNKLTKNKIKNGNQRKNTANEKLIKDDNEDNEYRMNNENDYFNINNEDYYDDDFKNDYDDDSWEKKKEAEDYYYVDEEDEKQSKKNEEVEDEDEPEQEQEDNLDEDYNEDEDKSEKSKEYDNYRENNKITSESDEKESINGFQNEKIDHMNPDEAQETADYADDYYDDINVELEDQINDEAEEERRKREKIKMTSDETSAEINYENKRDETDNWVAGKGEEEQYSDYEEEEEENDLKEENEGENKENNEEREEEEEDSNESEQEESKENDLEEVEEQEESKESELVEDGEDEEKRENEGESTEEVSDEKESVKVEEKEENFEGKKVEENEITDSNKKSVRTDADWIFQESEPHTEQNRTAKSVQTRTMELNDNEVGNNKATHKKYENNISKHNKNINENEEYVKKSDVKKVILDILESKRPDIEKSKEMFYKGPENKYNELVKDIESYFAKKNVSVGDDICVYEEYGSKHGDSDLIYLCGTKLYQNGVPKKDAQNFNLIIKNPYHNDNKKSTYEILIDHKNNNNYSPIKHNKHSNEKEDNSLNDKNKRSIKGEMKFMHKKKRNSIHNNKHTKEKEHNSLHDKNKRSVKREMKFMLQKKRNSNQKVSRKTKRLK